MPGTSSHADEAFAARNRAIGPYGVCRATSADGEITAMADVLPHVLVSSVMGKLYDVLTNGDETVPKSEDHFFSWATPGIPMDVEDLDFLTQGLTGVVKKADLDTVRGTGTGAAADGTPPPKSRPRCWIHSGLPTRTGCIRMPRAFPGSAISWQKRTAPRTISSRALTC